MKEMRIAQLSFIKYVRKNRLPHGGISKRFFLDHFSHNFRPKIEFFDIDSILRVNIKYELVK